MSEFRKFFAGAFKLRCSRYNSFESQKNIWNNSTYKPADETPDQKLKVFSIWGWESTNCN